MPRKKIDPSLHKKRGPKPATQSPEKLNEWRLQLERAIFQASSNLMTIQKNSFWTQKEMRACWGIRATKEFGFFFEAKKVYDNEIADFLLHQLNSDRMTEEQYKKAMYTSAYRWMWVVRPDRYQDVWKITRRQASLEDIIK